MIWTLSITPKSSSVPLQISTKINLSLTKTRLTWDMINYTYIQQNSQNNFDIVSKVCSGQPKLNILIFIFVHDKCWQMIYVTELVSLRKKPGRLNNSLFNEGFFKKTQHRTLGWLASCSPASRTQDTSGMAFIYENHSSILLSQVTDSRQKSHISIHGKHSISRNEPHSRRLQSRTSQSHSALVLSINYS